METLLCRRVELARAGEPNGLQSVLQEHVTSCLHCRDEIAVDHAIRTSLRSEELLLPPVTRRRIEQLVTVRSRPHAPWAGLMMAALTGAAVALLAVGLMLPPSAAQPDAPGSTSLPEVSVAPNPGPGPSLRQVQFGPAAVGGEPVAGLSYLVDRHLTSGTSAMDVPLANVVYEAQMPLSLANQLVSHPESDAYTWDGMPAALEVHNATLFVLERSEELLDPVIADVLQEFGSLTLNYGPHQLALAARDDRVFLIIADPAGLTVAMR